MNYMRFYQFYLTAWVLYLAQLKISCLMDITDFHIQIYKSKWKRQFYYHFIIVFFSGGGGASFFLIPRPIRMQADVTLTLNKFFFFIIFEMTCSLGEYSGIVSRCLLNRLEFRVFILLDWLPPRLDESAYPVI